jgi:protein-disulfide isomerase/mRNA-degrading endonuclease HigB of HigAB toxin-antitoxin module
MYNRLSTLDGADFSVEYNLYVADRDQDIIGDSGNSKSEREMRNLAYDVRSYLANPKSVLTRCINDGGELLHDGKNTCDGDDKPKKDTTMCKGADGKVYTAIWASLEEKEWEYQDDCDFSKNELGNVTWSYSAKSTYNEDAVECTEVGCILARENDTLDLNTSDALMFAAGNYFQEILEELEDQIPKNFDAKLEFSGKGFSISNREKGEKYLPDIEVGLKGEGDFSSLSVKLDLAAKVVDDKFYYKVDSFPMLDITEGHMGEWIEMDTEQNRSFADIVPEYQEEQKEIIDDFRNFIAQTKDYDILEFVPNGKTIKIEGVTSKLFDVTVKAENIPTWLEDVVKKVRDNQEKIVDSGLMDIKIESSDEMTEEDKVKIVNYINKTLKNLNITAGISTNTGDLMYLELFSRILPTADSKKFADKQFNSVLKIKAWNQNSPSKIEAPGEFISYDEIDQEKKGLDDLEYADYKQSMRITSVRQDLDKYYKEHKKYPDELKKATKQYRDLITDKEYKYSVDGNNYALIYTMNNTTIPPGQLNNKPSSAGSAGEWGYNDLDSVNLGYPGGYDRSASYKRFYSYNYVLENYLYWHSGENQADRYSPVADQHKTSDKLVVEGDYTDHDVYVAVTQSKNIRAILSTLKNKKSSDGKYPDNIDPEEDREIGKYYYNNFSYCEDLMTSNKCDYKSINNGEDFELKVNFGMDSSGIAKSLSGYNYVTVFDKGINTFNEFSTVDANKDTDRDGLLDIDELKYGTDINNKDTDGDGYYDGEEVRGGYNPLGSGLLGQEGEQVDQGETITGYSVPDFSKDWYRGDKDAGLTVITFSDVDCPFCARFHTTMNEALDYYEGQVNWIHRHFPLTTLHPDAKKKAHAAECVGELGDSEDFWAFLDYVFENSESLADLDTYVTTIGIDSAKFKACQDSGKYNSKIETQATEAQAAGGRGTPFSVVIKNNKVVAEIPGALPLESIKATLNQFVE